MMTVFKASRHIKGINLIELMVALALGSFLSIGIIQMYTTHRLTTWRSDGVAEMQDNIRYAMRMMAQHARMAGYTGCISKDRGLGNDDASDDVPITNLLNNSSDLLYDFGEAIEGFNNITATLPAGLSAALSGDPTPIAGTDVLILRGASDDDVPIT
ncbi:MAG: hypothetical protein R3208_00445, partial [Ketobacteraceae bacterium]|nr:hypothetical protein [Ketobacteraceae bacterium]